MIAKYTRRMDRLLSTVLFGSPPNTTKKKESIITIGVPRIIPWTHTKERALPRPVRMAFGRMGYNRF